MNTTYRHAVLVALAAVLWCAPATAQDERTTDREKIIDVSALAEAMKKATAPVSERIKSSQLEQRFSAVKDILASDTLDKEQLLGALDALKQEMDAFVSEWDQVTNPLWEAQDTIAETIDRVRATMAGGGNLKKSEKSRAILANYEKRLDSLAQRVVAETDPVRQAQLKKVYANILSLRNLTERAGSLNLSPASEAVHFKIIRALSGLQGQLTFTTFEVERVRVVLTGLSDFVTNYNGILSGLVEAEKLAKFWSDWNESDTGLGAVFGNVDVLVNSTEELVDMMDSVVAELAESIEIETAEMAVNVEGAYQLDEAKVNADIKRRTSRSPEQTGAILEGVNHETDHSDPGGCRRPGCRGGTRHGKRR